ncbi:leucine-rich repeat receptor-like protein kinase TDR [Andrographis paniculata]|uniref:leucine-rich repeat receptor-like protein kinase TDR n=1 Tax=Andrographis paniculata TaxID=175694 RepID=UPI0021E7C5C2|nr:leucine-rich repeat receptor-like protein kinase TDR [Andrographis paniculata]
MTSSPLLHTLSIFITISIAVAAAESPEILSLLSIKSSLTDPLGTFDDWVLTNSSSSYSSTPIWCTWTGIKCSRRTGHVTALDLSGRNLSGNIPPDINALSHLHYLNLSRNSFAGEFPAAILRRLPNLKILDINHNSYSSLPTFPPAALKSLNFFNAYSNSFAGALPESFVPLKNLEYLNLGGSYFSGEIPASYGSFSKLRHLYLHGNSLTGPIPAELGNLKELEHFELGYNSYSGGVPLEFSDLSKLEYLDISSSNLSGNLPTGLARLGRLQELLLFKNHLSGPIPENWAEMKSLQVLDLSDNNLSGRIPTGFSGLESLRMVSLLNNNLSGEIPGGFGDLPNLEVLYLWNNSLSGILPKRLGSNSRLQSLDVSSNSLTGPIPRNLCLGDSLVKLVLFSNRFFGEIPLTLANCTRLSRLRIHDNRLNGSIPYGFGSLPNLTFVDVSGNGLSGLIPDDLANARQLGFLNISGNSFESPLPGGIWKAPCLKILLASSSGLTGKIPRFEGCTSFYRIELDGNDLDGSIPGDISQCTKLISLNLSRNSLSGIIPWEIASLPSITNLDLSRNHLTGAIPSGLGSVRTLENLDVSYNRLTGPLPSSGVLFSSLHPSAFAGNEGLCGKILDKPCQEDAPATDMVAKDERRQPKKTAGAIVWIMAVAFGIGVFILVAGSHCRGRYSGNLLCDHGDVGPWKLTAFQRLNFTADDVLECLNMSENVIGMGSTGAVYKAKMPSGDIIAVKKLWGKNKDTIRRRRGVLAEVDVLGTVRHRNIVRLLGCCSNAECTMLLYEYMANGSLDDLLHGKNKWDNLVADWSTRYKIALGVAQGVCYLHHDCDPVIVHRDLKPSNILLDEKMEARLADFGVAKLIHGRESMSVIAGSYGYIAPEYAYTLQVDERSDVYSYGVVLMEILTGKRSVDSEFGDGNCIVDWVKAKIKIKNGVDEVLDKNAGAGCASVKEEMLLLLRIALLCTCRNPADRPSMRDVVSMLQEVKPGGKLPPAAGEFVAVDIPATQKPEY